MANTTDNEGTTFLEQAMLAMQKDKEMIEKLENENKKLREQIEDRRAVIGKEGGIEPSTASPNSGADVELIDDDSPKTVSQYKIALEDRDNQITHLKERCINLQQMISNDKKWASGSIEEIQLEDDNTNDGSKQLNKLTSSRSDRTNLKAQLDSAQDQLGKVKKQLESKVEIQEKLKQVGRAYKEKYQSTLEQVKDLNTQVESYKKEIEEMKTNRALNAVENSTDDRIGALKERIIALVMEQNKNEQKLSESADKMASIQEEKDEALKQAVQCKSESTQMMTYCQDLVARLADSNAQIKAMSNEINAWRTGSGINKATAPQLTSVSGGERTEIVQVKKVIRRPGGIVEEQMVPIALPSNKPKSKPKIIKLRKGGTPPPETSKSSKDHKKRVKESNSDSNRGRKSQNSKKRRKRSPSSSSSLSSSSSSSNSSSSSGSTSTSLDSVMDKHTKKLADPETLARRQQRYARFGGRPPPIGNRPRSPLSSADRGNNQVRRPFEEAPPNESLFIGNLHDSVDKEELRSQFEGFGQIKSTYVSIPSEDRPHKFGFVSFHNILDATAAMNHMDGKPLCGQPMTVKYARPRQPRFGEMAQDVQRMESTLWPGGNDPELGQPPVSAQERIKAAMTGNSVPGPSDFSGGYTRDPNNPNLIQLRSSRPTKRRSRSRSSSRSDHSRVNSVHSSDDEMNGVVKRFYNKSVHQRN